MLRLFVKELQLFDYPYLETLLAVETEGTFEKAARLEGVTRSAISQKIRLLEERWGAAIITRKPVSTTKLGHLLCRHIEHVRLLESRLQMQFGHQFDTSDILPNGIPLVFQDDLHPTGYLQNLTALVDEQSDFYLDVTTATGAELAEKMKSGLVKTAISTMFVASPLYDHYHLGSVDFQAVASPRFAKSNTGTPASESDLWCAPSFDYSASSNLCARYLSQRFGVVGDTNSDYLPSTHGILNACLDHKCWAMLPSTLVKKDLLAGRLVDLGTDDGLIIDLYFYISKILDRTFPNVAEFVLSSAGTQS